jgi:hypothetical protein
MAPSRAKEFYKMRKIGITTLSMLTVVLLAGSAFAGTAKNVNIGVPVTLNGTAIPEGEYKVSVADDGLVTIAKGKKVLVTAQGKLVDRAEKADSNSIGVRQQPDGTQKLTEINFAGTKSAVVFTEGESKSSGN